MEITRRTFLFSSLAVVTQQRLDKAAVSDFDQFLTRVMDTGLVPGLSVSAVRGADIVYSRGFGFADRETRRPVSIDTQFYIASTTKSFTALAAAVLASKGVLDLDAPLSHYLPVVKLHEPLSPDHISIRDLLTHTHGIRANGPVDFREAFTGEFTNDELLKLLQLHPPAPGGRAFAYSNLGYNIFSLVLDGQFKEGWKNVIQREVIEPLRMRNTTAWISRSDPKRLALPYEFTGERPERVFYAKQDENMQAAGGHLSSANDLARYLQAQINAGRIDGHQALPTVAIQATQRQYVDQDRTFGPFHHYGWGLGWDIAKYDGDIILQRFGDFSGFRSHLSFMPERHIGVAVLANGGAASSSLTDLVATYIYDRFLGKPDLSQRYPQLLTSQVEQIRNAINKDLATRRARPQATPLPLAAFVGSYENAAYGRMTWIMNNGLLKIRMGVARGDVEVYDGAKYQMRIAIGGSATVVTFQVPSGSDRPVALQFLDETFLRSSN